jgi:N-methylhydantoinase A/acetophenone carboxylase
MFTADIDVGGTFTDGFFSDGQQMRTAKVLTTPHDVSECVLACLGEGARAFGMDLRGFLRHLRVCRVSTTLGTNLLVQRLGPKVGLLVSRGHEEDWYGSDRSSLIGSVILPEAIRGVDGAVSPEGRVLQALDRRGAMQAIRELIHLGCRMLTVSLRHAWANPVHERAVREILLERYPVHYLRSVPLQLSTEVAHVADDRMRTNTAVINAYIHDEMARALYRMEDRLREAGYRFPLLIVHASGGCARVAKTIAIHTLHSGPAVATRGAAAMARRLGLDRVVTADMGGTSLDAAIILDGQYHLDVAPRVEGVPVAFPMVRTWSLGAGGGSIASVEGNEVRVGPRSAGSVPGPACYAKGGMEPTVTDADVTLGFIDPDYFLGGRMRLDPERAARALERRIARPLGIGVEEAAARVRETVHRNIADSLERLLSGEGHSPRGFAMFAFGGAGPLHAVAVAELLGIDRVVCFPFGSVFGAFGSSTVDVMHLYSRTLMLPLNAVTDEVITGLRRRAERDMAGEGFEASSIRYEVQAAVRVGPRVERVTIAPGSDDWWGAVAQAVRNRLGSDPGHVLVESLTVTATCPILHWQPGPYRDGGGDRPRAGRRRVVWDRHGPLQTDTYRLSSLRPGDTVDGPAIVEAPDTNYAVPPGWRLEVDPYGNLVMVRGPS